MGADTERQRSLILHMCKDTRKPAEHRQISNIRRTLVGNTLVDHSDVVGAATACSNFIFILVLTPGFNGFRQCKLQVETIIT